MNPVTIRSSIDLAVPAATAWAYLSDYSHDLTWRAGLERMAQDPPGQVHDGARVEEVLTVLGRRVESLVEVSEVQAGRSFRWQVVGGATPQGSAPTAQGTAPTAQGSRTVTPTGEGSCRVDVVKELTLSGADRLLRPLIAVVVTRTERGDLRRLKQRLEQPARTAAQ
ncbi:SRPBCC family protein [Actinotalea sp. BY-33]|uniref:SRPBCC family protein n=1 Tax=Actinotalea soli TaxID=2819234 RepID=A0A939LPR6_9CELL|nr:SRPBCC family protein [Actinotalea soli]MBO1751443.1 SRPBCC family protein [Actinotalea soli]